MNEQQIVIRYRVWRGTTAKYHGGDSLASWRLFQYVVPPEELAVIEAVGVTEFYYTYIGNQQCLT